MKKFCKASLVTWHIPLGLCGGVILWWGDGEGVAADVHG